MAKECVTHHHACDCREAYFAELEAKVERLEERVSRLVGLCAISDVDEDAVMAALQEVSDGD